MVLAKTKRIRTITHQPKGKTMTDIKNAIIESTKITNDDHGCLSAWLYLDYGGSGQGFGGFSLYIPKRGPAMGNYAGHFIWRVLEIADVTDWDKLIGKTIRVKAEHEGIQEIGHILKDIWFNPKREFKTIEKETKP
jgi:hypothetical protein